MSIEPNQDPGFLGDPTDGRKRGEWQSRYPAQARRSIWREALWLTLAWIQITAILFVVWLQWPGLQELALPFLGGAWGGTLFSIKWLYHAVAHQQWHEDRLLWRLCTPVVSGTLALVMLQLVLAGIFPAFDAGVIGKPGALLSVGFLVGYFSDSAIGKLGQVAEKLFGPRTRQEAQRRPMDME